MAAADSTISVGHACQRRQIASERIENTLSNLPKSPGYEYISYAEWGSRFFETAVTPERIGSQFAEMAGQESTIGPFSADPVGISQVTAKTKIAEPTVTRVRAENVTYAIEIPVDLSLSIEVSPKRPKLTLGGLLPDIDILGGRLDATQKLDYTGKVTVKLTLTARAASPLLVVIDIEKPTPKSVKVALQADGVLAALVQTSGLLEGEIKKAVAKEVGKELSKPELQKGLVIDVGSEMASFS